MPVDLAFQADSGFNVALRVQRRAALAAALRQMYFFFFREKKSACTLFSPDRRDCRSRKMLKNAPTLAIGGADTAENGPSKVRQAEDSEGYVQERTLLSP